MEAAPRYTLLTLFNTIYAIRIALHCLNSSMYAFKYSLERLERELE